MSIELNIKIKKLSINCKKCLDTKLVWKQRYHNDDNLGWFIILNCDLCSNSLFVQYSKTSNLSIEGVPIFNVYYPQDSNDIYSSSIRLTIVRKLYSLYEALDGLDGLERKK